MKCETLDIASTMLDMKLQPVRLRVKSKSPVEEGWPKRIHTHESVGAEFECGENVGVLLGELGGWVVDIDLAVLGQSDAVYRQFEHNVRKEYFFVRWPRYIAGRSAVLQGFLDRPRIYHNEWFFYRYESQARANLRHALAALQQGQLYA